uniref:SH2 domain-containing protein n=1 Tax=Parastrongyloides trichosuri TaxID=131310 RepID=A0A0N4Z1V3_PARTI
MRRLQGKKGKRNSQLEVNTIPSLGVGEIKDESSEGCRVTYSQFMANGKPAKTKEDKYRDEPICRVKITLKNYTDNKKVMNEILERSDYVIRSYLKKNYLSLNDNDMLDSYKEKMTSTRSSNSSSGGKRSNENSSYGTTSTSTTSSTTGQSIETAYYNDGNKEAMNGIKKIQKSKYSNYFIGLLTAEEAEKKTKKTNTFHIYCRILDEKCCSGKDNGWLQIYIVYKNLTDNYIHIPVVNKMTKHGDDGLSFYNFNNCEKYFKTYDELMDFFQEVVKDRPSILMAKYGKTQDKGCIPKINKNATNLKTDEPSFYNYYIGVKHQAESEGYLRGPLDFKLYHRLMDDRECLTCFDPAPQLFILYQCHSGQILHIPIVVRERNGFNREYAIYKFDGISPIFDNLNCITTFIFKSILDFKRYSRRKIGVRCNKKETERENN